MKIKVLQIFGRRRVMGSDKIMPGVYDSADPALYGLADELVGLGVAKHVAEDTPATVQAPVVQHGTPIGITHEEFEQLTGRVSVTSEPLPEIHVEPEDELKAPDDSAVIPAPKPKGKR
jgi:hypothetical protein